MLRLGRKVLVFGVAGLLVLGVVIALAVIYIRPADNDEPYRFASVSPLGKYQKAAVATNGAECSAIGAGILEKGGSAVDAAISALLCEGVASLHSAGLGGGFLMTIWDAKNKNASYLDARETAPIAASENMYNGNASIARRGGLSIAVPGELRGYWEAHQRFGKLKWAELFEPVIQLCKEGSIVNAYLERYLRVRTRIIKEREPLSEILIDPETNSTWKLGDKIKRLQLAKTLELIASKGPDVFYNGTLSQLLVKEIQSYGGIITLEDFRTYTAKWKEPLKSKIGKHTVYTAPPPGSGVILTFIMNILDGFIPDKSEIVTWQRVVEAFKWAYAKRTLLGDPDFVLIDDLLKNLTSKDYASSIRKEIKDDWTSQDPEYYGAFTEPAEDAGTSHVSVLAPDGSAVSVTTTINQVLGSYIRSQTTGIIFNDEMDDFSAPNITNGFGLPPSPANFIRPGKRPMSSMSPTIVVDDKDEVRLVIGAAGGTKITSSVSTSIMLNLWFDYSIKEAIDAPRLHHQVIPMRLDKERTFPTHVLEKLEEIGHKLFTIRGIGSAMTGIAREKGQITANSDYRRMGTTSGF